MKYTYSCAISDKNQGIILISSTNTLNYSSALFTRIICLLPSPTLLRVSVRIHRQDLILYVVLNEL
jgi:hypothetical protein